MDIKAYIKNQAPERQNILSYIHETIVENDPQVTAEVETMMGKEMIVYKGKGFMKYGLSSVKNYMSLHAMPIYGSPQLHAKYKTLLHHTTFQKGCINFVKEDDMPIDVVKQLIIDASKIDLLKIKEAYINERKSRKP